MRFFPLVFLATSIAMPSLAADAPESFTRQDKGYCIACHQLPAGFGPESRNDVGPRLEGERMRALGKQKVREIIEDATQANPDSVMPPFGRHRILDAREIDRLTEFLNALP
jgi:sulfur-oxidizing protein SoxX